MINKVYNYTNTKYTKLTNLHIAAIVIEILNLILVLAIFISVVLTNDLSTDVKLSDLLIVLGIEFAGVSIIPLGLVIGAEKNRKLYNMDTWVKSLDNKLYFFNSANIDEEENLKNINFLNDILQKPDSSEYVSIYEINKVNAIEEKEKYIKVIFNAKDLIFNDEIVKKVYIMKTITNYNELLEDLYKYTK
ncbi:MAG: hypothetical protein E7170_04215 [Firmicutes bacterium]|nr:hypothetical protein [Bacillota bacterium]